MSSDDPPAVLCGLCAKEMQASIREAVQWKLETLREAKTMVETFLKEREFELQSKTQQILQKDHSIAQ